MQVAGLIPQLRSADLEASIRFCTEQLGFGLGFRFGDFYAGIRAGTAVFHLKRVDAADPSIGFVADGEHFHLYFPVADAAAAAAELALRGVALARPVHETAWGTREFSLRDDQGHVLYFGQVLPGSAEQRP